MSLCKRLIYLGIFIGSFWLESFAAPANILNIRADKLTVNQQTNVSIFTGNVILTMGDTTLQTTKITVYLNLKALEKTNSRNHSTDKLHKTATNNNRLKKIVINQFFTAKRLQKTAANSADIAQTIIANYAEYNPNTDQLSIKDNVAISHNNHYIYCDEFSYKLNLTK